MICSSEKRFFTSNLLALGSWTPDRAATQNRGDVACTAPPAPAARSSPWSPCSAPAHVEPVRLPLFSKDILDDLVLEHLLSQQLLQAAVLGLQLLQALRIGHAHAPKLAPPQVVR